MDLQGLFILLPAIAIAITVHEFSHAWMANRLGDPTARLEGRLTLNPMAHLDPVGTLCLFLAYFGWGRPVPVNTSNFKHPLRDDMFVSACGPLSNFLTAFLLALLFKLSLRFHLLAPHSYFYDVLRLGLVINLSLCFFNLIPLYPLDGSHILRGLLPRGMIPGYERFSSYSPFLLLSLVAMGSIFQVPVLGNIMGPPIRFFSCLFISIL
ncbi:MAG: site-2 protease family protein [Planctomycetes bacterium]|nr:site-2 protease family protein [Planctomycetota bacterium]